SAPEDPRRSGLGGRNAGDRARRGLHGPEDRRSRRPLDALQVGLRRPRVHRGGRRALLRRQVPRAVRVPRDGVRHAGPSREAIRGEGLREGEGEPRAAGQRPVPAGLLEGAGLDCPGAQPALLRPSRPLRAGRPPDPPRELRRVPGAPLRGPRRNADRGVAPGARRPRSRLRGVLPRRRVLQPRLQLHRRQQPRSVLLGCARAAGADDAAGPGGDRPKHLPQLRPDHLRPLGARLPGVRPGGLSAPVRSGGRGEAPGGGRLARYQRQRHARPLREGVRVRASRLGRLERPRADRRDAGRRAREGRREGERPAARVGFLRRAHRRGELRGGLARLVGLGPEPRPVPVLALLAVPSEGIEQRLLLQPRGGPPHGRGAPRDARIRAAPALPPSPRDLPGRRAGRLRDERVGQVRLPQGRRRHRDLPDRLHGDLARPDRLVEARGGLEVIRYVARRILLAVPTLAGIVVLVFLLLHLAPGSPVTAAGGEGGRRLSGRAAEEMRRVYGLDRPLPERFGKWVLRVVRLDLGESFVDRRPVSDRILEALPYTLTLNGLALLLTLLVA